MNKRTYKKIQNRMYREIKRRIEAEQKAAAMAAMRLPRVTVCADRRVETIAVKCRIPADLTLHDNRAVGYAEREMASEIARKLYEDGYICFVKSEDCDGIDMRASIDVLRRQGE